MRELWPLPHDPLVEEVDRACRELELARRYRELDRDPLFPRAEFRELGRRGLLGLTVPTEAGGRGLPPARAAVLLFHLAYRAGTTFAKLALQPEFSSVLLENGSKELVDRYFRPLVRGELLVGNQITEPGAGSDVRALELTAERDGEGYLLSGTKSEAAFAADADAALVYARFPRTDGDAGFTAFLVPQELPGIERSVAPADLGERWQRRGEVRYDRVRLPGSLRVGTEGEAFAPLLNEIERDRGLLAAIYLGVARASLDETVSYVGERRTFGRPLSDRQSVTFPLVEAATSLQAAWLLTQDALSGWTAGGQGSSPRTSLAKELASVVALETIDLAIQFHGGRGYSSREVHEQRYRDVRSGRLAHGASEVLKQMAARTLWSRSRSS